MKLHPMKSVRLLSITFSLASALSAADLKIGTVDVAKAFSEYYKSKDANARLQKNATNAKEAMQERLAAFKKLNDDAKALGEEARDAGLPDAIRAQKRIEMQAKVNEL